jgi:legumain
LAAAAGALSTPPNGDNWAVIIAGSNSYDNYRHQADACHAYQIVKANGIPEDKIIMFAYDDIAGSSENPFPGKIFNRPTKQGTPGKDVYAGCNIDYAGKSITPLMFSAVLAGNETVVGNICKKAGGKACRSGTKVLKSTSKDNVFVNFVDHGGSRIIGFPDGAEPSTMSASQLVRTLQAMKRKEMYNKLTFYMEACNSGSMFDGLLTDDMNVYVTTAANPNEPSWGTFCAPYDKVDGKELNSCLGDLYSVNWMNDSDTTAGMAHTLEQQFTKVQNETKAKSHVMQYGTKAWSTDLVSDFQSHASSVTGDAQPPASSASSPGADQGVVDVVDIDVVQAFYRYLRAPTGDARRSGYAAQLVAQVEARTHADTMYPQILAHVDDVTNDVAEPGAVCEEQVTLAAMDACGKFSSYALKYSRPLTLKCETHSLATIKAAISKVCA